MDSAALKPDVFFANMPSLVTEAEKKGASTEEIQLATMAESAGWKVLKEFIGRLIEDLDNKNSVSIANGLGLEEIGLNTIVVTLAKETIKRIVNKVEDSREACAK
jgi:hypothetical protein